jgi:hypothetical protein
MDQKLGGVMGDVASAPAATSPSVPKAGLTCGIKRVTAKSNANSSFIITILRDIKDAARSRHAE